MMLSPPPPPPALPFSVGLRLWSQKSLGVMSPEIQMPPPFEHGYSTRRCGFLVNGQLSRFDYFFGGGIKAE